MSRRRVKVSTPANELLQGIYDQLPGLNCSGRCWDTCGPIDMGGVERKRIAREARIDIPVGSYVRDGPQACPALSGVGRCTVYDIRPLICRVWGLTEMLPCTYGCVPERMLTHEETYELLAQVCEIGGEYEKARTFRLGTRPEHQATIKKIREALDNVAHAQTLRRGLKW